MRCSSRRAVRASEASVAARLREYQDVGIDTVIGSGYPHLEEAYRVSELLFPEIGLGIPHHRLPTSFGHAQVFGGGGHGGNLRVVSGSGS